MLQLDSYTEDKADLKTLNGHVEFCDITENATGYISDLFSIVARNIIMNIILPFF